MSRFNEFWKKFGETGDGDGGNTKLTRKKIWWLAGLMALGALLVMVGSAGDKKELTQNEISREKKELATDTHTKSLMAGEEESLSGKLQEMLAEIEGAGKVKVTVRLAASAREDYAINTTTGRKTTQEKDQGGGTRVITENTDTNQLVLIRGGSGETPVVEQERAAQVAGVLVVADGARDPRVKARLFQAVRVALGVEPQKILVLPSEKGV